MTEEGGAARMEESAAVANVSQAVYTWANRTRDRPEGYGFVAVSPDLQDHLNWLEANTREIAKFVGSGKISPEQRAVYRPLGRSTVGGRAVTYRKTDAGFDGHGRVGRYIVHFLVADAWDLPLSLVLSISDAVWLGGNDIPLNHVPDLKPRPLHELVAETGPVDIDESRAHELVQLLPNLLRQEEIDITRWPKKDILALIGCLPSWADHYVDMTPLWIRGSGVLKLRLNDPDPQAPPPPDLIPISSPILQSVRDRLVAAPDLARCLELLKAGSRDDKASGPFIGGSATTVDELAPELERLTEQWVREGSRSLDHRQRDFLLTNSGRAVNYMIENGLKLPPMFRAFDFVTEFMKALPPEVSWAELAKILRFDDHSAASLLALAPIPQLLLAVVWANCDPENRIEIQVREPLAAGVLSQLNEMALSDEEMFSGLVATVVYSGMGEGTFIDALVLSGEIDSELLYGRVIRDAFGTQQAALMGVISRDPTRFLEWMMCPEPYRSALAESLRLDPSNPLFGKIREFLKNWRRYL